MAISNCNLASYSARKNIRSSVCNVLNRKILLGCNENLYSGGVYLLLVANTFAQKMQTLLLMLLQEL